MRKYETIVVFNPSLSETAIKDESKKIEKILESYKAQNIKADAWGRKQIAYSVKKNSFGTFVCFNYESDDHGVTAGLTNQLRIIDSVIKFQTHRINDRVRKFRGNPKRKTAGTGDEEFGEAAISEF